MMLEVVAGLDLSFALHALYFYSERRFFLWSVFFGRGCKTEPLDLNEVSGGGGLIVTEGPELSSALCDRG
jgi:hypothetical protein